MIPVQFSDQPRPVGQSRRCWRSAKKIKSIGIKFYLMPKNYRMLCKFTTMGGKNNIHTCPKMYLQGISGDSQYRKMSMASY